MSKRFRITPRALYDLENIGRYTMNKWGKEQRNRYLRELDQRFGGWRKDRLQANTVQTLNKAITVSHKAPI